MIENTLTYLLIGSHDVLPSSYTKLRNYLNIYSADLARQHQLQLFKRNSRCPYCHTSWECDSNSFKLLPTKNLKTPLKKKTPLKVKELSENKKDFESRNTLVLKCIVCTQRSPFSLIKKKYIQENVQKEGNKIVKKKRKKKDKLSGLLVNLKNMNEPSSSFFIKKKEGLGVKINSDSEKHVEINKKNPKPQSKTPVHLPAKTNSQSKNDFNKKLLLNPLASLRQNKISQEKNQKLKELKKAIKENDSAAKKTLKDFLTLI